MFALYVIYTINILSKSLLFFNFSSFLIASFALCKLSRIARLSFAKLNEGDEINVRVIGIRYELNDEYISIIAELVKTKKLAKPIKIKIQAE